MDEQPVASKVNSLEEKEILVGAAQYRMLYRELRAEEHVGLSTPILSKLGVDEDDFLKGIGVADKQRILIVAEERKKALLRWRTQIEGLGSLLDPDLKKKIETEVEEGIREELAKKR